MTKFCRYIDDQPSFFFWEMDELLVFSCFFGMGFIIEKLFICMVVGVFAAQALAKIKRQKAEGFLYHLLYWYGIVRFRRCPKGEERIYLE